jgi:pyridinium-3,5-biscarboxylic acid mononucleotide synthase
LALHLPVAAMNERAVLDLLNNVQQGRIAPETALESLRRLPYADLDFAKLDLHRGLRSGFPEVILCEGKRVEQVVAIFERLCEEGGPVLGTRADVRTAAAVREAIPSVVYNEVARTLSYAPVALSKRPGVILVVSAGTADLPVAEEAAVTADIMGNTVERIFDVGVAGLHRLLAHIEQLQQAAVLIVIAGMEGALPSVIGGLVRAPVIAVPTSVGYGASFNGLAALLGMLNSCASGVTVVNIDNGFGAGYAASRINLAAAELRSPRS